MHRGSHNGIIMGAPNFNGVGTYSIYCRKVRLLHRLYIEAVTIAR